jgi:hypothetical protein
LTAVCVPPLISQIQQPQQMIGIVGLGKKK